MNPSCETPAGVSCLYDPSVKANMQALHVVTG